ncbi:hypothetical protein, partial [Neobacillus vireti]|uniref:hypothetical protein n=1 Tax=Neobacillus vireti TaxID=220686 RepID=UPI002FFEE292
MLYISDPLSFKESILISLEVLPEYGELRGFAETIPKIVGSIRLDTSMEMENKIGCCIKKFKETKTYFWLREDFKNSLYDIEIQV